MLSFSSAEFRGGGFVIVTVVIFCCDLKTMKNRRTVDLKGRRAK